MTKITQYGPSIKSGGWDPDGDSSTDAGWGCWGNKLTIDACALTDKEVENIDAYKLCWVEIDFQNGTRPLVRQYQDRAPEDEARCDLYMLQEDKNLPDFGVVKVIPDPTGASVRSTS